MSSGELNVWLSPLDISFRRVVHRRWCCTPVWFEDSYLLVKAAHKSVDSLRSPSWLSSSIPAPCRGIGEVREDNLPRRECGALYPADVEMLRRPGSYYRSVAWTRTWSGLQILEVARVWVERKSSSRENREATVQSYRPLSFNILNLDWVSLYLLSY